MDSPLALADIRVGATVDGGQKETGGRAVGSDNDGWTSVDGVLRQA